MSVARARTVGPPRIVGAAHPGVAFRASKTAVMPLHRRQVGGIHEVRVLLGSLAALGHRRPGELRGEPRPARVIG